MLNLKAKSEVYDKLYDEAAHLLELHNPCDIHKDDNGKLVCNYRLEWCCEGCKHLTENGCGVKSLSCKLWLCGHSHTSANKPVVIALDALRNTGMALGVLSHSTFSSSEFRLSKEEVFK